MQEKQKKGMDTKEVHNGSELRAGAAKSISPIEPKLTSRMQRKESNSEFIIALIIPTM